VVGKLTGWGVKVPPFSINNNADHRVEMNYLKIYCNLIRKAEQRSYTKSSKKEFGVYVEGHHTFPKSIYGKNRRIVYLTAKEHYIAHALLEKICIKRYGLNHWKTKKMNLAFCSMNSGNEFQPRYKSTLYEFAKIRLSVFKTGIKFSDERKTKISIALKGKKKPPKTKEHLEKCSKAMKGVQKSDEHKLKISKSHKEYWKNGGRNINGENNSFYNKNHSDESKKLIRDSRCNYTYTFISPEGKIFETINAKQFCINHNLSERYVYKVANGKKNNYKGWKVTRKLRT
jgi:hypothetical protein